MADIRPFQALRPAKGLESRVAALPYDVYNRREAKEAALKEPLSFLNIDRPETQFPDEQDMYAPEVYQKAHDMFENAVKGGIYEKDPVPCFYLYQQTWKGRSQCGIVACASIDDYIGNVIKKHENTRADKEQDRIRHVDTMNAQTGPIFLTYRSIPAVTDIINLVKETPADYSFAGEDGVTHTGWIISDEEQINVIRDAFAKTDSIYIADGHHRCASAVKVGLQRREAKPDYDGSEEFNYFLCVLFPDEELMIMDYNRVVLDLNGMTPDEFLLKLGAECGIRKLTGAALPAGKGQVMMYLAGSWYEVAYPENWKNNDPVEGLDVSILQERVLTPILGIGDPRTDRRIDFVGGIRGYAELEKRVDMEGGVAFAMYPTSIGELFDVADSGLLMPPKSTWFEPKLRSGLYIHMLS